MNDSKKTLQDLTDSILAWWKEHENDSFSDGEDEHNTYDEKPEFVRIAEHANVDLDISRNARLMIVTGSRQAHEPPGTYLVVAESEEKARSMFFSPIEVVETRDVRSGVFLKLLGGDHGK